MTKSWLLCSRRGGKTAHIPFVMEGNHNETDTQVENGNRPREGPAPAAAHRLSVESLLRSASGFHELVIQ